MKKTNHGPRRAALRRFRRTLTFRVDWSEYGDEVRGTHATAQDLATVLRRIALREHERGGYCKTQVTILRDGRDWYTCRLDVQRDGFDTDIRTHVTTVHRYYQSEDGRRLLRGLPAKFQHRGTRAAWLAEAFAQEVIL